MLRAMNRLPALLAVLALLSATALAGTKGPEPLVVSHGTAVNLADYVVPGKTTIFDFTSKYCGPCQAYNQPLHDLHARRADVAVVKVDINRPDVPRIDWQSPVARQYDLHSIPHFKVYGPDGKLVAEDKVVFGADGRPDRAASKAAARHLVDQMISRPAN
jgi:thiol-disulfide isomerase/thioredoxin